MPEKITGTLKELLTIRKKTQRRKKYINWSHKFRQNGLSR